MNWRDLGKKLATLAPATGAALAGPGGAVVGAMLAEKVGASKTPDAVWSAMGTSTDALVRLREIEAQCERDVALGQIELSKIEASHGSMFVAGVRPAAIWVCVAGLAYGTIVQHVIMTVAWWADKSTAGFPEFDLWTLATLLGGLLGLGSMRTAEKFRGVARGSLGGLR